MQMGWPMALGSPADLLYVAALGGTRALGHEQEIGDLRSGKTTTLLLRLPSSTRPH